MWQPCLTQTSYQSPTVGFKLNSPKLFPLRISQFPPAAHVIGPMAKILCHLAGIPGTAINLDSIFFFVACSIPSLPNSPFAQSLFPLSLLFFPIFLFLKGLLWKASGLAKGPYAQAGSQEFSPETLPVCLLGLSINSPSTRLFMSLAEKKGVTRKQINWLQMRGKEKICHLKSPPILPCCF